MKIIEIGICADNKDPKGLGRIRYKKYSEFISSRENAFDYEPWSTDDPFVVLPFLPLQINPIPQVGQAVKVISYDTDKESLNREYISGPFSNSHDFLTQSFTKQVENTTYGIQVVKSPDIFNTNGEYVKPDSIGAFAKKTDYSISGPFGSDIVLTENGIQLRGGKLISKNNSTPKKGTELLNYPIMSKKIANLSMKKFAKKLTLESRVEIEYNTENKNLNYLVEYEVDDLTTPTVIKFYVYKILKAYGTATNTNNFNENTILPDSVKKLINTDNTTTTPTHTINIVDSSAVYTEINDVLHTLHRDSLNKLNTLYQETDLHPFYYRPTKSFLELEPSNPTESTYKDSILDNIEVYRTIPNQSSLVWAKRNVQPTTTEKTKTVKFIKEHSNSLEQTISSLRSDKIYLLSTDPNETEKNVNFTALDKYELTQEDYVGNIEPNTYSIVRGENLLRILNLMLKVLFDHRHNPTKPMAKEGYNDYIQLVELIKSMENDLLNKSIKIN